MRYIHIPVEVKKELVSMNWNNPRSLNGDGSISWRTLENALWFKRKGALSKAIRAAALQRGGVIYDDTGYRKGFMPDCTTNFDHTTGIVRQELPNGVVIEIDTNTDLAVVYNNAVEIARFETMTVNKWGKVLFAMQNLYSHLITKDI